MTFSIIQDRYNAGWQDLHNGLLSNRSVYNDTGGGTGAASDPATSYYFYTGQTTVVATLDKKNNSCARVCNQDKNLTIRSIRLEINTDASALDADKPESTVADIDVNIDLNQHELYEMTMGNVCVGAALNYELWKNGKCFVALTPEQVSSFFSSDGVLFPVNISGRIVGSHVAQDGVGIYKLVMTMYYFKSHLQLQPSSAAFSDQLLSEEAYRSLATGRTGPTQSGAGGYEFY